MTHFCPTCWQTVDPEATSCSRCGSDLTALDRRPFVAKLISALHHPEPMTRQRAAFILGELHDATAVPALGEILVTTAEPFLAAEIAGALGKINGPEAEEILVRALDHRASVVRLAVVRAVIRCGGSAAAVALRKAARDPSPSVRRLAREMQGGGEQC